MANVRSHASQTALPFDERPPERARPRRVRHRLPEAAASAEFAAMPQAGLRAGGPLLPESPVSFVLVRSPRARRYILRLRPDGVVRVTIPLRGSRREALDVIERHRPWIERQWRQRAAECRADAWKDGTRIYFRGVEVALAVQTMPGGWQVRFADQVLSVGPHARLRDSVEARLRELAREELEPRVRAFANALGLAVTHVTVRNQRTRWGSCSRRGRISLNWRLIQMPAFVSDYIVLHELMHLRQANHSRRFWLEVESVCPGYREAETWLRRRGRLLW